MADKKISALTSASTPLAGTEVLPIVQSGATVKVAVSDLTAGRTMSAANLGVGVTSPSYVFDARSGATATTGSFSSANTTAYSAGGYNGGIARVFLSGGNGTNAANGFEFTAGGSNENFFGVVQEAGGSGALVFQNYNGSAYGERHRISSVGIVTMPAYGAGTATFSASGVISSVSDETWKIKNGEPVNTDAMIQKLKPGYWYYNDEKKEIFGSKRQLGFYAQNVNAAIGPEAAPEPEVTIAKAKDGSEISVTKPWGYYDRSVLAVVVMSLKKALAAIETLEAKVAALEAKT
jgi:hypothetical protein